LHWAAASRWMACYTTPTGQPPIDLGNHLTPIKEINKR